MKKLLILPLLLVFQIVSAQWNAIGWNPFTLRSTSGDSTFVLSAPSRVDLQKGTASWVPERQASYLVYTALLTQTGTDAPVATVLENTLGGTVVWTRESEGVYHGTLSGAFTSMRTVLSILGGYRLDLYINEGINVKFVRENSDNVSILTDGQDAWISDMFIEIRVYP